MSKVSNDSGKGSDGVKVKKENDTELVRNNCGVCHVDGNKVIVKRYDGTEVCNCSVDEFLALVPMINGVNDKRGIT